MAPHAYYRTVESCVTERPFQVTKFRDETTTSKKIEVGALQGCVIGSVMLTMYHLLTSQNTTVATFIHDAEMLAAHEE
jgi:hypothetical protein